MIHGNASIGLSPPCVRPGVHADALPGVVPFALLCVLSWVGAAAFSETAQFGDSLEQLVWAQSAEWGYYKHPPLPTWMLWVAIQALGHSPKLTFALAGVCIATTGMLTFAIARRLLGAPVASLALLLWGLQQPFSVRAQIYNHDTVLMLFIACTAYCAVRAGQTPQWRWWLLGGLAAGASLLSKYQAVLPLAGIAVALWRSGALATWRPRAGLALACVAIAALVAPHLAWVAHHDWSTLRYADQGGRRLEGAQRAGDALRFALQQLRLTLPALVLVGLACLKWRPRMAAAHSAMDEAQDPTRSAWLLGLLGVPLVATLAVCLCLGLPLQYHWGFQDLQFVSLWLAFQARRLAAAPARSVMALALAVHAPLLVTSLWPQLLPDPPGPARRIDVRYPAALLAEAVRRDWRSATPCPLKLIVGPSFEAGMVAFYSSNPPRVLEDGDLRKSPWISADELARFGAVYVSSRTEDLPVARARERHSLAVEAGRRVEWVIAAPPGCDPTH